MDYVEEGDLVLTQVTVTRLTPYDGQTDFLNLDGRHRLLPLSDVT